jgi:hypothetical protein
MMNNCPHCGADIDAAHLDAKGEPLIPPPGCQCDLGTWHGATQIPPPCDKFEAERADMYCRRCEHDYSCHPVGN